MSNKLNHTPVEQQDNNEFNWKEFIPSKSKLAAAALILAGAVGTQLNGSEGLPEQPSAEHTTRTVAPGENMTTITETELDKCGVDYDDHDTQNAIARLVHYNSKNTSEVAAIDEVLRIPDNFCEITIGE